MVTKVSNLIIDKMGTLINHDYQWTSKSCKDMFVQKLGNCCNNACVATLLWAKCGGEAQHSKVGNLESSGTPECL
jgi:hypothetical protein